MSEQYCEQCGCLIRFPMLIGEEDYDQVICSACVEEADRDLLDSLAEADH